MARTPKDSKEHLSWYQLIHGMMSCYNLSFPFAFLFVLLVNLKLKTFLGFSVDDLKPHGVIEHDASLSRHDAAYVEIQNTQGLFL